MSDTENLLKISEQNESIEFMRKKESYIVEFYSHLCKKLLRKESISFGNCVCMM